MDIYGRQLAGLFVMAIIYMIYKIIRSIIRSIFK
jgi:hypothetical protein